MHKTAGQARAQLVVAGTKEEVDTQCRTLAREDTRR